ncbi:hypothetical protein [Dyella sp.]|uniref:hypothetical protein n=1 Tax=Dyella sp. TaxID=1869338 RepID=UPI002ED51CF7
MKHPCGYSLFLVAIAATSSFAHSAPSSFVPTGVSSLSCDNVDTPAKEAKLIAQMKGIVQRVSKHELRLHMDDTSVVLKDKPPYDEAGGDVHTYCGTAVGFALVSGATSESSSGTLYELSSGKTQPGGFAVAFSPDRRLYLARSQDDGMDGELWDIYSIDGKQVWKGESILIGADDQVAIDLDAPHWISPTQLEASAECDHDITGKATLTLQGDHGVWQFPRGCKKPK